MTIAGSGRGREALEEMLVADDQAGIVDDEIGFEPLRQAEIDITQSPRPLPVVALARARDRQGGAVDEGDIEREARARGFGHAADRKGVAEGRDRQVGLVGTVEIRAVDAVDAPAAAMPFEPESAVAVAVPTLDLDRECLPARAQPPAVIKAEAAGIERDDRGQGADVVGFDAERHALEAVHVGTSPEQDRLRHRGVLAVPAEHRAFGFARSQPQDCRWRKALGGNAGLVAAPGRFASRARRA